MRRMTRIWHAHVSSFVRFLIVRIFLTVFICMSRRFVGRDCDVLEVVCSVWLVQSWSGYFRAYR